MAVSHQTGVILNHWNDCPTTAFVKNKSATSSTTSLATAFPTPPATPFQEKNDNETLVNGLAGLLNLPTRLQGRNKEMIVSRIQGLIKSIQERKVSVSQCTALEEVVRFVEEGERSFARERVIKLMSEERGIAAWATALRMVIENLS